MAPYGVWLKSSHRLKEMNASTYRQEPAMESAELLKLQAANGEYSAALSSSDAAWLLVQIAEAVGAQVMS